MQVERLLRPGITAARLVTPDGIETLVPSAGPAVVLVLHGIQFGEIPVVILPIAG